MRILVLALSLLSLLGMLTACGGAGSASSSTPTPAAPAPNIGGGPAGTPVVVPVASGQTASGMDITVPSPSASPAINATVLGVAPQASNAGDVIHQTGTTRIVVFGPGLDANTKVTISGPGDITVGAVSTIRSQDGTQTGIAFNATVTPSAALGARSVIFENPQGDISTFTGGLEVVP